MSASDDSRGDAGLQRWKSEVWAKAAKGERRKSFATPSGLEPQPLYGGAPRLPKGATPTLVTTLRAFRRQALHAERIEFAHPVSGETVAVQSPRPADLDALIGALREDARG